MKAITVIALAVAIAIATAHQTTTLAATAETASTELAYIGPRSGPDEIVAVAGIQVHASLAPHLARLLNDARQNGLILGGWGWRSHTRQHQLRQINGCPNDGSWTHTPGENPARWTPSSACRIMTARPGASMHETGLAIDFICAGRSFAGTPCYRWMVANAHHYGLYNLPGEPWHWSTTGR